MERPSGLGADAGRETDPIARWLRRGLRDAYRDTLREDVPVRLLQLAGLDEDA